MDGIERMERIITENLYKRILVQGEWLNVIHAEVYSDGSMLYFTNHGYVPAEMIEKYGDDE